MKNDKRLLLIGTIVGAFWTTVCVSVAQHAPIVELKPGFATLITLDRAAKTVAIGNPEVADVSIPSPTSVLVTGKDVGRTNLIIIDETGKSISSTIVTVGTTAGFSLIKVHNKRSLQDHASYHCDPTCTLVGRPRAPQRTAESTPSANVCEHPDDIAEDGSRCGDRATSAQPAGRVPVPNRNQ